ncbi:peptide deformylase [Streptomyces sp. NPDC048508]|uniref:peptide deformylase n=1 Tax=Streptomyces sp. NPDC048508 TaxID=3365561 RepID=UPI0037155E3D
MVLRPLQITLKTTTLEGRQVTTTYERGLARLGHHEIDHLDGLLYTVRMRTDVAPIPVPAEAALLTLPYLGACRSRWLAMALPSGSRPTASAPIHRPCQPVSRQLIRPSGTSRPRRLRIACRCPPRPATGVLLPPRLPAACAIAAAHDPVQTLPSLGLGHLG